MLSEAEIAAGERLAHFQTAYSEAGGIVSFTGQVRGAGEADPVRALMLQAHPELTQAGIKAAIAKTQARFDIIALDVAHRVGTIAAGETIVFVVAAAHHRREAFLAVDYVMDYLKTRAIFWKREDRESGSYWIEPRESDYEDAKRWRNLA